ncbi:hypothetical protein WH47_04846 [Habropoda laboriosa]|uniref:Histone-lysine N-methyltransferase SETMAR n=1 Tax=Habropoda laboriosa TaxID=597456 RepID=A0A0L7QWE3_9HYME|nr:hypothetical protein WH47_04846 [Habropoda laboriosa]
MNLDVHCAQLEKLRKTCNKVLREFGWEILSHPPYSPDVDPSDYHLFRALHFLLIFSFVVRIRNVYLRENIKS